MIAAPGSGESLAGSSQFYSPNPNSHKPLPITPRQRFASLSRSMGHMILRIARSPLLKADSPRRLPNWQNAIVPAPRQSKRELCPACPIPSREPWRPG